MNLSVIIVDDELASRRELKAVVSQSEQLTLLGEASNGVDAIAMIKEHKPDIVFLDIEMPEVNGLAVAQTIKDIACHIVFVTAFENYALSAFETLAVDYILKPARPARIKQSIEKILMIENKSLSDSRSESPRLLQLQEGNHQYQINLLHIRYIEGIGRYRRLHLSEEGEIAHQVKTILSDTTLDAFEALLPNAMFLRVHRSYLCNLDQISILHTHSQQPSIQLHGESTLRIPVARKRLVTLKQRLAQLPKI